MMAVTQHAQPSVALDAVTATDEAWHRAVQWALLAIVVVSLWLVPLGSSFWLDETGTYWVVRDGLGEAIRRALSTHGQSPLYYVVAWAVERVAHGSEVVLRLPSVAFMGVATYMVSRLARRLLGEGTALPAAIVFAALPGISFAAGDARPYALATLCAVGASLALLRLDESGRRSDAVVYALAVAATVYSHYVFALAVLPHAFYALSRWRQGARRSAAFTVAGQALGAVLVAPALVQLASLYDRRELLSVPNTPQFDDLFAAIAPPLLVGGLLVGMLLARAAGNLGVRAYRRPEGTWTLLLWWAVAPPALLVGATMVAPTSLSLAAPRYLLVAAPAQALLAAAAVRALHNDAAKRLALVGVVAVMVAAGFRTDHVIQQDWRGAAQAVNEAVGRDSDVPVLVHAGFVESADIDLVRDADADSFLLAPLSAYPMRGRVVVMPYDLSDAAKDYLRELEPQLARSSRFVLVTGYPHLPLESWFQTRMSSHGFPPPMIECHGGVCVRRFLRAPTGAGDKGAASVAGLP